MIKTVAQGGLNMIDTESFVTSILASWIPRILNADKNNDSWVQLPMFYLQHLLENKTGLLFNFDDSVQFNDIENLPAFYRNVVKCYNKIFCLKQDLFENNIMNESIWGNKFITTTVRRKKNVLFLRDWVRSGVRIVNDLCFADGLLDIQRTYDKIIYKQNVYCELLMVRQALSPFQDAIRNKQSNSRNHVQVVKSKQLYSLYIEKRFISDNPSPLSAYLTQFDNSNEMQSFAFTAKVSNEKEIKLKEFNFKVLHGILPCNFNLKRWRIKVSNKCDICDNDQTIQHLLFECFHVKPIWNIVNYAFNLNVTFMQILGFDENFDHNAIVTIVTFLIYKEWLLKSLEHKNRAIPLSLEHFKAELQLRLKIYEHCNSVGQRHVEDISHLISSM